MAVRRARSSTAAPPLWRCPRCGHRFVTRNLPHSCGVHALDEHFRGAAPGLRAAFEAFVAAMREHGELTVEPQKSRIVLVARIRFAGCIVQKKRLWCALLLPRRADDPRFERIEHIPPRYWVHRFPLVRAGDVDRSWRRLFAEAYAMGAQTAVLARRAERSGRHALRTPARRGRRRGR